MYCIGDYEEIMGGCGGITPTGCRCRCSHEVMSGSDPLTRLMMQADGVSDETLRRLLRQVIDARRLAR